MIRKLESIIFHVTQINWLWKLESNKVIIVQFSIFSKCDQFGRFVVKLNVKRSPIKRQFLDNIELERGTNLINITALKVTCCNKEILSSENSRKVYYLVISPRYYLFDVKIQWFRITHCWWNRMQLLR
jgi:hypothetical protein